MSSIEHITLQIGMKNNIKILLPSIALYAVYEIFIQLNYLHALSVNTRLFLCEYSFLLVILIVINSVFIIYKAIKGTWLNLLLLIVIFLFIWRIIITFSALNPY